MTAPLSSLCTNVALRRAARNIGRLYDDALSEVGLRATQFALLSHIEAMNGPVKADLAEELVMDPSALSHTLKPLVRDGLVRVTSDKSDARVKRVTLTREGGDVLKRARPLWRAAQERLEQIVGADEAARTRHALSRLASADFTRSFAGKRTQVS